jgi:asparagine synthase (glutamine-hydrolysing)
VRRHVTVALAGDGGDELFGGNARYAKQRVFEAYARVPAALRRSLVEPLAGATRGVPLLGKAFSYVEQARTPLPARMDSYNLLGRLGIERVLTAAFRERVDLADAQAQQQRVWDAIDADDATNRQLAFDWRYTLAEADLPKVVGTTALAGIEVGFPMLAQPLVDFSLSLPVSYKLRGTKLRWFFKEALRGFLPDEIIAKRKQGFGLPFGVWALADAALGALANDALCSCATRGIVEPAFIAALESQLLREHPGYYGEMVWILVMLEHWLRAHAPDFRID